MGPVSAALIASPRFLPRVLARLRPPSRPQRRVLAQPANIDSGDACMCIMRVRGMLREGSGLSIRAILTRCIVFGELHSADTGRVALPPGCRRLCHELSFVVSAPLCDSRTAAIAAARTGLEKKSTKRTDKASDRARARARARRSPAGANESRPGGKRKTAKK
jgi:hypothetical protein